MGGYILLGGWEKGEKWQSNRIDCSSLVIGYASTRVTDVCQCDCLAIQILEKKFKIFATLYDIFLEVVVNKH